METFDFDHQVVTVAVSGSLSLWGEGGGQEAPSVNKFFPPLEKKYNQTYAPSSFTAGSHLSGLKLSGSGQYLGFLCVENIFS